MGRRHRSRHRAPCDDVGRLASRQARGYRTAASRVCGRALHSVRIRSNRQFGPGAGASVLRTSHLRCESGVRYGTRDLAISAWASSCAPPVWWYILNLMVQYTNTYLDASFAALSDVTRRGVLEQLGR